MDTWFVYLKKVGGMDIEKDIFATSLYFSLRLADIAIARGAEAACRGSFSGTFALGINESCYPFLEEIPADGTLWQLHGERFKASVAGFLNG